MESKQELSAGRYVTVFTTTGANGSAIKFDGTTWRDLQSVFSAQGISSSGMKAVIGETQMSVESDDALLPTQNFTLFLLPQKTKSGGPNRAAVQQIIAAFGDKAKLHFNRGDQNYTRKTDAELGKLLAAWEKKGLKAPATPVAKATTKSQPKAESKKSTVSVKEAATKAASKVIEQMPEINNEELCRKAKELSGKIPGVEDFYGC